MVSQSVTKAEIADFFDFGSKFLSLTVRARITSPNGEYGTSNLWDSYGLITGDYDSIPFPVTFKQDKGKVFHDVLNTGHAFLFLISDRMKALLEENNLTGWKCFPILLLDKNGNEIYGYQGLTIVGRCGPIDYSKSDVIHKRLVPQGPICKFYKGLHIGLDQWDGSDFFLPMKTYGTIVTKKAADIVLKNKLTNIELRNLAEIEVLEEATRPRPNL